MLISFFYAAGSTAVLCCLRWDDRASVGIDLSHGRRCGYPARLEERVKWSRRDFVRSGRGPSYLPHASLSDCVRLTAAPDPLCNQD